MNPITTKFERNKHLRTKSTLHQIGWLDEETGVDIWTEWLRRGYYEACGLNTNKLISDYFDGGWDYRSNWKTTYQVIICDVPPYTTGLPSCLNTTFLAMEGPIKDHGFTTEWKSLAIADGTIFMFDYDSVNLIDGYGPDYCIDHEIGLSNHVANIAAFNRTTEIHNDYDNKKKY